VVTAVAFSVHMILLARVPRQASAGRVALGQMSLGFLVFAGGAAVFGGFPPVPAAVWAAVAVTGVLASALAFWVQTFVQQRISATRTAIILVAEPAFAVVFGYLLGGDRFTTFQAAGAGLVLFALLLHEAAPLRLTSQRL